MNEIREIVHYSEYTAELRVYAPSVAKSCRPGHFVIVRFSEDGARIPFTIVDSDEKAGTINILIHKAAGLSEALASLQPGDCLPNLLGPLGQAIEIKDYGTVVCCGDGAGFVPLLPIVRALKKAGNHVISVFSEQSSQTACLQGKVSEYSEVIDVRDRKAVEVVDEIMQRRKIDKMFISGPTLMMKEISGLTRTTGVPTVCILNMIMVDGVGLCGICRVMVDGERKLTCIDGPSFDAHKVDFDQLLNRQRLYV
ncbi:MAG: sulfide/dihydroorotate dehydrogenase-like FAD/NAD-binding protein [Muribaculum sp.]|nr:sulfide/dihydroorotate dehydrogenase-like FAD/NAD-binding protein [Muribaculum sp.]